jgi:hypothetical protein
LVSGAPVIIIPENGARLHRIKNILKKQADASLYEASAFD